ncbi:MAG TPA: SDR family NAD(P)-dependent oxidoreductase [Cytophagaceae bacterium]
MNGKIAIITGAAMGIGKVAAMHFLERGAKVIIWDIDEKEGLATYHEFKEDNYDVEFAVVDTTSYRDVERETRNVFAQYGQIDILINNAGITKAAGIAEISIEQWKETIDINLTGIFNCTKAIAPIMVKQLFGRIINTSSMAGLYGETGQANYSATRSGMVGITKVWARELSRYGITVNAVVPGFIETEEIRDIPENIIHSVKEKIPVGRLGVPDDVANVYLFLASDSTSYISGSVIYVDGGYAS